jgi:hypothetical protein
VTLKQSTFEAFIDRQKSLVEARDAAIERAKKMSQTPTKATSTPKTFQEFIERQKALVEAKNAAAANPPPPPQPLRTLDNGQGEENAGIPAWMAELGRQAVRQMKLESIRIEYIAKEKAEQTFHPELQSDPVQRENAGKRKEEIMAEKQQKIKDLKKNVGKERRKKKAATWRAQPTPERTQELREILTQFQTRRRAKFTT